MHYIESGSKEYRRALISMLLGGVVTFANMYYPQPLLNVFSEEFHVTPSTASFAISSTTVALAISMLFISLFSNAWGRKMIMGVSLISSSVLTILSAFGHNFNLLLAIRLLEGFCLAGFPATAMAYLNEEFSPRSIGGVMGMYIGGTAVGGVLGRIVVGAMTDYFSWQASFMVLGIISLLCSLWFWFYLPKSKNSQKYQISFANWASDLKTGIQNKRLLSLYGIGFLLMGAYVTLWNYIGYPLTQAPYELSQTVLGSLFVVSLVGTWSSIWFGKLTDSYPRVYVIYMALGLLLVGALLTLNHLLIVKGIGITIFAFGFFAAHTVASGWVGVIAPRQKKAQAASLYLLFYYTGSSVVGWSGGFFWIRYGWGGVICMISCLLVVSAFLSSRISTTILQKETKLNPKVKKANY